MQTQQQTSLLGLTWQDWITILSLVFGIVGAWISIVQGRKASRLQKERESMSWAELIIASSSIADSIKDSGFWPQIMVAPDSRGGIIARLISQELQDHNINIPILVGITVWKKSPKFEGDLSAYDFLETKRWGFGLPKVSYANPGQKILIVDDIVHSGDTLERARQLLVNGGVPLDNIRTAALVVSESAVKNQNSPDFFWKRTLSTEFLFPWGKAR